MTFHKKIVSGKDSNPDPLSREADLPDSKRGENERSDQIRASSGSAFGVKFFVKKNGFNIWWRDKWSVFYLVKFTYDIRTNQYS